ncbi:glycosyltransferase [Priestia megaterium]|uniref:glycosyltransferase n=1 Tax=Priestia megaterium TaxID=1404 RepID=UPI001C23BCEE|nr:glycosyltransferase [Priestia megaterium]MBU8752319.1 glycosyltransferase [Priestia megaterium]
MRIGILSTFVGSFGQKGFYNVQEIGLAKELDKLFDEVIIYKTISKSEKEISERVDECYHTTLKLLPTKHLGINGLLNLKQLDRNLDALIYFSDTQIIVPQVYNWCKKNNIKLIPYIGVTESHSGTKIKRFIINNMFKRNIKIYRKSLCLTKTPQVRETLESYGVKACRVAPVGLDLSILKFGYNQVSTLELKEKWGFKASDKIVLFVGRLVQDKEPLRLIEIFEKISFKDSNYKLLIIGKGYLNSEINTLVREKELQNKVKIIEKIPNTEIWEMYRIADAFVNLSKKEIFGMAILEAMFYKCKVVAWNAPGPRYIIENGISGFICETDQEVIDSVLLEKENLLTVAYERVMNEFTWKPTALLINKIVKGL